MMIDSLSCGAGDAQRAERGSTRVNIKCVLPRLPRDLNDTSLNLPRFQPLHRFLDRTKLTDEGILVRHPRPHVGHLLFTSTITVER